jgi:hypothetical protein
MIQPRDIDSLLERESSVCADIDTVSVPEEEYAKYF